jgi:hypothetical protein
LNDDRPSSHFVDKVNRAAGEAHAVLYGFSAHGAREMPEAMRVNVHNGWNKRHEYRGQEPHEPGKHNQFHFTARNIDHRLIKGLSTSEPFVIQDLDGDPMFGAHEAVSVGAIAEHDLDFASSSSLDGVDDGLKISAAARNQYADGNLSCMACP